MRFLKPLPVQGLYPTGQERVAATGKVVPLARIGTNQKDPRG